MGLCHRVVVVVVEEVVTPCREKSQASPKSAPHLRIR